MSFSENLKELRIERGLSQKALAEKIGYVQSIISDWENGRASPSVEAIIKLALLFEVSADSLLGINELALYDSFSFASMSKYKYVFEKIQSLSLKELNQLIDFLNNL